MKKYYCTTCKEFRKTTEQQDRVGWEGILVVSEYCDNCTQLVTSYTYLPVEDEKLEEYRTKVLNKRNLYYE